MLIGESRRPADSGDLAGVFAEGLKTSSLTARDEESKEVLSVESGKGDKWR